MAVADLTLEDRAQILAREQRFTQTLKLIGIHEPTVASAGHTVPSSGTPTVSQGAQIRGQVINDLESDDAKTRRDARVSLANNLDSATASSLLKAIKDPKANYRAKLGAAVVLKETSFNVALSSDEDVRAVAALIGDDDPTLRTNASEFVMKMTDPATVTKMYNELTRIVRDRNQAFARPNQVYNAVAILGTWMRVLPDSLSARRDEIQRFLLNEKQQMAASDTQWAKTRVLIDDLIKLRGNS